MPAAHSILIVEDDHAIAEGLEDGLLAKGYAPRHAANLAAAREALAPGHGFAMILLDLMLPDGEGLTILDHLESEQDRTPVIIVSALGEEDRRITGLERGADDYVVKPFSVDELEARMRAIFRRALPRTPLARLGHLEIDFETRLLRDAAGSETRLLQKEAELLAYLLGAGGRTVTREELLREVWGYRGLPRTRTVDTHVFNLRKKIEEDPRTPRHLHTIHGRGYRLDP